MKYKIPTNAKIISINDESSFELDNNEIGSGLRIVTNKGDITLIISDSGQCCEEWGANFLETPDNIEKYIGATIISVEDTNDRLLNDSDDSEETQLRIVTTKGVLQYAVYNEHNGYYGHATFKQVFDLVEKNVL